MLHHHLPMRTRSPLLAGTHWCTYCLARYDTTRLACPECAYGCGCYTQDGYGLRGLAAVLYGQSIAWELRQGEISNTEASERLARLPRTACPVPGGDCPVPLAPGRAGLAPFRLRAGLAPFRLRAGLKET
jgi:hypothetical protein